MMMQSEQTNELTDQLRQLIEQGQSPAPAWVVRLLSETAGASGQALADRDGIRAELDRATAQAREIAIPREASAYGARSRSLAELLVMIERQLSDARQDARHYRERIESWEKRAKQAEEELQQAKAQLATITEAASSPGETPIAESNDHV